MKPSILNCHPERFFLREVEAHAGVSVAEPAAEIPNAKLRELLLHLALGTFPTAFLAHEGCGWRRASALHLIAAMATGFSR